MLTLLEQAQLFGAIKADDRSALTRLIGKYGYRIGGYTDVNGDTPLACAARANNPFAVSMLINFDANPNIAWHIALASKDLNLVTMFLLRGMKSYFAKASQQKEFTAAESHIISLPDCKQATWRKLFRQFHIDFWPTEILPEIEVASVSTFSGGAGSISPELDSDSGMSVGSAWQAITFPDATEVKLTDPIDITPLLAMPLPPGFALPLTGVWGHDMPWLAASPDLPAADAMAIDSPRF
jgi:hypothetical protein